MPKMIRVLEMVISHVETTIDEADLITGHDAATLSGRSIQSINDMMSRRTLPSYLIIDNAVTRPTRYTSRAAVLALPPIRRR